MSITKEFDTITAISTPLGEGAIGIVRLSGTDAVAIANKVFKGKNLETVASHTINYGHIVENDEKKVILSNSATDTTGSSVSFEGDLGQISGDGALIEAMIKDTSDWENNLYLELTTTDKSGTDNMYQLQMSLTEVTDAES